MGTFAGNDCIAPVFSQPPISRTPLAFPFAGHDRFTTKNTKSTQGLGDLRDLGGESVRSSAVRRVARASLAQLVIFQLPSGCRQPTPLPLFGRPAT
jgi:hypothetical protein